ncbi:MAG: serine/threonine protein kinase [Myxococcales bacterium]|nr:serine/threonine protein kinase [Myxococcales bacterium]
MADSNSKPSELNSISLGGLAPGAVIGGTWLVERLLGKGGMGAVWLARHQRLPDKYAAIKVLLGTGLRDEAYLRFAREAEIATRIGHPNIVDVIDMDCLASGEPYIVLEYLQGEDLRARLRKYGALSFEDTCAITRQIGSALYAAHRHDVVHRDLKPENVYLVPTDSGGVIREHVKVLDFGISKLRGSQTVQTQEATLLGTPQYMAPEQASGRNQDVDARTDQFALAVMVYEMITGRPPWQSDTPLGLLFQVVHSPTPALGSHAADLPQHAVAAIEKALSKNATERFGDVCEFVEALTGSPLAALQTRKSETRNYGAQFRKTGPTAVSTNQDDHVASAETEMATMDGTLNTDAPTQVAPQAVQPKAMAALPPSRVAADPAKVQFEMPARPAIASTVPDGPLAAPDKAKAGRWIVGMVVTALVVAITLVVASKRAPPATAQARTLAELPDARPDAALLAALPVAATAGQAAAPAQERATHPTTLTDLGFAEPQIATKDSGSAAHLAQPVDEATTAKPDADAAVLTTQPDVSVEDLATDLAKAQAAFAAGDYLQAERHAARSLTQSPSADAFGLLAKVHCQRGDLSGAKTWYGQIRGGAKSAVRKYCETQRLFL